MSRRADNYEHVIVGPSNSEVAQTILNEEKVIRSCVPLIPK